MTSGLVERRLSDDPHRPSHLAGWADRLTDYWSQIKVLDFAIGVGIAVGGTIAIFGSLTVSIAMCAVIILVGSFRRPQLDISSGGLMLLAAIVLFGYLVLVSVQQGTPWGQRIFRFSLILGMAAVIAQRRIDIRSLILGLVIGSIVNVPAFYAGLTPNDYPPYLTGWYGDKNVAGMYYAALGILGLFVFSRRWAGGWLALSSVFLFLTGSRTSMSAFVLAVLWLALRNRVSVVMRLILTGVGVWLLVYIENTFARIGVFADRVGTDWFRGQIEQAMADKVAATPWYGGGLNEGYVILGGVRRAWFHDAYLQAFVEGGYVFLGATLIAFAIVGLGLFSSRPKVGRELLVAEAAVVVVLVCAWKIGEGFMTTIAFIVLGVVIGERLGRPSLYAARERSV